MAEFGLALLLLLLASPVCAGQALPRVDLRGFEPEVREQIRRALAAAQARPRDAQAAGRLGMVLHGYEQYEAASAAYARARRLAPGEFRWAYGEGVALAELGRHGEAIAGLRAALVSRPGDLAARLRLAESLLGDRQMEESRRIFAAIVADRPDCAAAFHGLGRAAAALGERGAAVESQRRALQLFPEYGSAAYALGILLRGEGSGEEARRLLETAERYRLSRPPIEDSFLAEIAGMNAGASKHLRRARALEDAGRIDESIAEHERALTIDSRLVQARVNLISLYGRKGDVARATAQYEAAMVLNPNLADLHYNYGVLLVGADRPREAAEAFRRCVELNPFHAEAHHNIGVIIERDGRLAEAAEHYRQALRQRPDYRSANFHLGRVLVNLEQPAEALVYFRQSVAPEGRDDEDTPTYLYALGATCSMLGDQRAAIDHLRDALRRATARRQTDLAEAIRRDLRQLTGK